MRKKKESLQEIVDRLVPCTVRYWTQDAHKLSDAAEAGLCKMEVIGMPNWRFTKLCIILLPLLLSLLLVGVAEAAHFELPDNCHWTSDDPRTASFTCETPPPGTVLIPQISGESIFKTPPCYERMQEAMKAMDRLTKFELGLFLNKSMQEQIGTPTMDLWRDVMKECVR